MKSGVLEKKERFDGKFVYITLILGLISVFFMYQRSEMIVLLGSFTNLFEIFSIILSCCGFLLSIYSVVTTQVGAAMHNSYQLWCATAYCFSSVLMMLQRVF